METTKLSSKGQVIIPKVMRKSHHWEAGLELAVIDTGDGILLKPKVAFPATSLNHVAGILKDRVTPKTDDDIEGAVKQGTRKKWRDSN